MKDLPTVPAGVLPGEDVPAEAPTVVDLATGSAHITPVEVDGVPHYAVSLPETLLTDDDVQGLAVALHTVRSGPAVLVDVQEYAGIE